MKISKNIEMANFWYNVIRYSKTSWRKRGTYRKKIKRRINKLTRQFFKRELNKNLDNT